MPGVLRQDKAIDEIGEGPSLDSLLELENEFFKEGFALGEVDGIKAGRTEGRLLGLEKGFEKFEQIAKLHGQALVIAAKCSELNDMSQNTTISQQETADSSSSQSSIRLRKHASILEALTEFESLSIVNDEDSVSELDDRLKRAQAKLKIIRRLNGESLASEGSRSDSFGAMVQEDGTFEDFNISGARR